ncbi:pseudouridine synthase [Celerinatantimonas diazotrophica]|uniref:Pseudouridine synthase n=1 Tax=Celerinatantimonas diazotrophica TaxID=412034 RepID=A0A4R1KJY6_9GAMM|nr:pseudouridine synthase [Celerinatantimonas diazotrophica]TCK63939.1 ribosomal small subunit pseudouridine synthase A [Celerinatantimonas diazotrophica]CAG9297024.1 Ribosomal small subunit pseudouridine synthase A [Celerinatantimonas diazotrophica]
MSQRLDKFVSHATGLPRSEVKKRLKQKHISINGKIATQGKTAISETDLVTLQGQELHLSFPSYFMLNKPAGYTSTREDPNHPSALDIIDEFCNPPLHAAGRLDADTTGLLLLTNDGQWSHQVTSPRHHQKKVYLTTLAKPLTIEAQQLLCKGVMLRGEETPTLPGQVERVNDQLIRLTIVEGRYHQVKRMLAAVDNKVTALHREQIGTITLDSHLKPGEYRRLSHQEVGVFLSSSDFSQTQ